MNTEDSQNKIDRLLDAIDLVKLDKKGPAYEILRELIREDNNFEDAWLWMSVVVNNVDQSTICLDNVLRVNPNNTFAAGALYRLRESEMRLERRRSRLILLRDLFLFLLWSLTIALLYAIVLTYSA
jgi:hypothetical protein